MDSYNTQLKTLASTSKMDYFNILDNDASDEKISGLLDAKRQEFISYFR